MTGTAAGPESAPGAQPGPVDASAGPLDAQVGRGPGRSADWCLVALLTVLSGVLAVFGIFFLPTYFGAVPVPLVVVFIGGALAVLPRLCYRLTFRMSAAVAPAAGWLLVTIALYLTSNPLYARVPIAWQGWQILLLLGVGTLVAAASIGLVWADSVRAEVAPAQPWNAGENGVERGSDGSRRASESDSTGSTR